MDTRREDGVAIVIALMALLLLTALGAALVMTTSTETTIADNFSRADEGLYAADAAIERAMDDLLTVPDWNALLTGSVQSAFVDGPPGGNRVLPSGSTLALEQALNIANCPQNNGAACSDTDLQRVTGERPWGPNNPVWQPYAYGPLSNLLPAGAIDSPYYVLVMVADDPSENDGDPLHDGNSQSNPGTGVLALRAEAFGPRGAHKVVEMTVARTDTTQFERGYTGQRGQDEQSRRARRAVVESPGSALTMQTMTLAAGGLR
jgi:hypothetical protein